jgi:2-keto-4-pentenoate hydratase/2-oxohepta-3-ene-1,7-dioic acid hydratase in catechol pathway
MSYKLLTYRSPSGPRAGILIGDRMFDAARAADQPTYGSVLQVLADWVDADACFARLAGRVTPLEGEPMSRVELLAPILFPGQIYAAGANYQDHVNEMNADPRITSQRTPESRGRPWFFSKASHSAVVGHGCVMPLPPHSSKVDWEVELAVVIGKPATRVPAARALEHVAGYTVANDLSARDQVIRDDIAAASPFRFDWVSHKSFDGSCPLGPWITPARTISDPQSLGLKLWVDDVEMQNSSTRHMIFSVAELIEDLSARITLNVGDLILTGTPSGVGMSRNLFLQPRQTVRLWIEKIGELRHSFS